MSKYYKHEIEVVRFLAPHDENDRDVFERQLNTYSEEGWELISCVLVGSDHLVTIFQRAATA